MVVHQHKWPERCACLHKRLPAGDTRLEGVAAAFNLEGGVRDPRGCRGGFLALLERGCSAPCCAWFGGGVTTGEAALNPGDTAATAGETAVTTGEGAVTATDSAIPSGEEAATRACAAPSSTLRGRGVSTDEELGAPTGEIPTASEELTDAVEDTGVTAGEGGMNTAEEVGAAAGGVGLGLRVLEAAAGCLVLAGGVTEATGMTCSTSSGCYMEHCNHEVASWHMVHSTSAGTKCPVLQAGNAHRYHAYM